MCDQHFEDDFKKYLERGYVTRRDFGVLSAGTAVTFLLPGIAGAQEVSGTDVEIRTPDGAADCYFVHPTSGAHAAVLVWPDILGLRTAFRQMGRRLAASGYSVLVVNPFYRDARAPVVPEGATFNDESVRNTVFGLRGNISNEDMVTDARAFIGWLDQQPQVDTSRKIGTTGYCMGGPYVMRTAAAVPGRVGAVGSFHGGGLVTEDADSPHRLVQQMDAQFLIAIAENDDERAPEEKNVLRETFAAAGLQAEIEVYPAAHGWCPPDSAVYNEAQAERAWSRLLALLDDALA
ncbi:MAG: dienelactone hydrolase family protein [Gammaproteobacteria bacterium]|jgi:carboxymethylenebutenolidase